MRLRFSHRLACGLLVAVLTSSCALAQASANRLRFKITIEHTAAESAVSGRLIVMMTTKKPHGLVEPGFANDTKSVWIAAREVGHADPGEAIELDPDETAFPAPFSKAPVGDYYVMAMLDTDHNAAYRFLTDGDLVMAPKLVNALNPQTAGTLTLALTRRESEREVVYPKGTEPIDFVSPVLSRFWGRPIHMKGVVVLPPSYESSDKKYPTVYVNHGYGAWLDALVRTQVPEVLGPMKRGTAPEMIYVLLLQECPGGTHEFADSVNNGPWGEALVKELIPHLESKYRMDGDTKGRFLTGHSSGGWATVWLQVAYPEVFGGAWATSPDPVDFRNFTGPNLRANPPQNFYRKPDGSPWMLVRMGGKDEESLQEYAQQEAVEGEYGGQTASFEWVFSPRGKDGRPMQLFDRATGKIDPAVAKHWEKYDISQIVRTHWTKLKPHLDGKLHIIVGTQDTFHLDESVRLLDETLKELGAKATIEYLPGRDHFNLYQGGLAERMAKEMYAVARPK